MTAMNNASTEGSGGGDGPPRPLRRSNTGKAVRMQDESGNMDGFADSHTTDWMISRLQQEQMAAVVSSSGQQISLPLGKDGQLSWKSLPELKHTKSEPAMTGTVDQRPLSPVISFSQFNDLFKSYNDQIPEDMLTDTQSTGSAAGKELFVDTRFEIKEAPMKPITPKNNKSLPTVSTNNPSNSRKGPTNHTPKSNKKETISEPAPVDDSQRILNSMQPHLDAFVAVNISKKSNNIQMVQKMLSGVKKSGGPLTRSNTTDAIVTRRPGGVSEVGKLAVVSQKKGNRVRSVDGFRNVFLTPESDDEESDGESLASAPSESSASSSEDSSDYDTDEEVVAVPVQQTQKSGRKLERKKTEKKMKTEDSAVIQERQMAIWEVLEIRTEDRVKLMNKYSTDEHSVEFRKYFSLWTEVALLVLLRQELKKVFQWYQRGLLAMPLNNPEGSLWIFQELLRRLPPLLKGTYTTASRNKKSVRAESPYVVLEKARGLLTFEEDEEQEQGFVYPKSVLPFLHSTVKHFDRLLLDKLNEVESTLDDVVPFGGGTCKEWLMSKAQKFPVPTS
jgi:hypothetical protein